MLKNPYLLGLTFSLILIWEMPSKANKSFLPFLSTQVISQSSSSKKELITELIEITQLRSLWEQNIEIGFSQFEQDFPQILAEIYSSEQFSSLSQKELELLQVEVSKLMKRMFVKFQESITFDEIKEQIYYPIYDKYYSEEELKELVAFYRTPLGQKTIEVTPQMMTEIYQATNTMMMPKMINIVQEIISEELPRLLEKSN